MILLSWILVLERQPPEHMRPSASRAFTVALVWTILWFSPIAVILIFLGSKSVYFEQAIFFSKAAVVTFGGAYAVLAYVAQQAVENYGWLTPGEMLDGLGLAETTPGPLILVLPFVGFLAAFRNPGELASDDCRGPRSHNYNLGYLCSLLPLGPRGRTLR